MSRHGRIWEIATLSVITGIAPNDLLECDPKFLIAIRAILTERYNAQKAARSMTRRR